MGTKYFASLYVGVPIAERMGLDCSNPFFRGLYILVDPCSVLDFEPTGFSLL